MSGPGTDENRWLLENEELVRVAMAGETPQMRHLIRGRFREDISLERLGEVYGVDGTTIARWLKAFYQRAQARIETYWAS